MGVPGHLLLASCQVSKAGYGYPPRLCPPEEDAIAFINWEHACCWRQLTLFCASGEF